MKSFAGSGRSRNEPARPVGVRIADPPCLKTRGDEPGYQAAAGRDATLGLNRGARAPASHVSLSRTPRILPAWERLSPSPGKEKAAFIDAGGGHSPACPRSRVPHGDKRSGQIGASALRRRCGPRCRTSAATARRLATPGGLPSGRFSDLLWRCELIRYDRGFSYFCHSRSATDRGSGPQPASHRARCPSIVRYAFRFKQAA